MWRRVLLVLLGYSAIVIVGLSVPLALTVSRERLQRFDESRFAAASYFADLAARDENSGNLELQEAAQRYHSLYGEGVAVLDRNGSPRASAGITTSSEDVEGAVSEALRNQRSDVPSSLLPWSHPEVLITVPVGTGTQVDGAVVLSASTASAAGDVARAWAVIVAGAVGLLAVVSVIAVALSRWTVRPLTALSGQVNSLSVGVVDRLPVTAARIDFGSPVSASSDRATYAGPPEVRELARVFDAMAENVETAAAAQRRLVADSAHALRNPLAALRIRLDTLGIGLTGRSAEAHRKTTKEVDRLSGIVADLLALATAESRPLPPASDRSCDVAAVVADRYEFWSGAFADAQMTATLVTSPSPAGAIAAISADDLNQILDVLLSNAAQYAGADSQIEVGCRATDSEVTVWVTDSGRGVPDDDLPQLVNRFFRASGTAGLGSGLGLAIARALTERAGGVLTVSARRPSGLRVESVLPRPS